MFNPFKAAGQAMDLQKKMKAVQKELKKKTVEVSNNSVTIVMDGEQKLVSLKINPVAVETGKVEVLEKAIKDALSEALEKAQKIAMEEMSVVTKGMNIPGLPT